ncbi:MAG: CDP-alcohol phosphatidyltransferase family protein [Syntrophobacteraceae bacterium]|nr:CDP-alcohol phosphatidyltransferase family protein [Desulfobacteraceae bacterium]
MFRTAILLVTDNMAVESVFGAPAVRRLVKILIRLGFGNIHLVGQIDSVVPALSGLLPSRSFHRAEDEELLARACGRMEIFPDERVLLLRANHVVDKRTLSQFLDNAGPEAGCLVEPGSGELSGGIFLVDRQAVLPTLRALWSGEEFQEDFAAQFRRIQGIGRLPLLLDGRWKNAETAEDALALALSLQVQPDDGFIARHFDRHISRWISRRASRTFITPNLVTLMGMTMGLTAAYLLSLQGYWTHLLGAFLFVFCVIVDGVDGEVARLKLMESDFGHYLDVVTDNLVHAAIFIGIAFGLYHDSGSTLYLKMLWVLLGGFCLCLVAVYQCILRLSEEELQQSPTAIRLMALLSNRDFAYLIAFLAVFDLMDFFLFGAALGSYAFAGALWIISSRERRKHRDAVALQGE